ncbi:LytTR family transcriptional regulator DNA-binding domain-containing protein [Zobellia nedashkovskayae]
MKKKLPDSQFVRIHKSYIINLKRIEKFNNTMVEVEGKKITLSRSRRDFFMSAIGTS